MGEMAATKDHVVRVWSRLTFVSCLALGLAIPPLSQAQDAGTEAPVTMPAAEAQVDAEAPSAQSSTPPAPPPAGDAPARTQTPRFEPPPPVGGPLAGFDDERPPTHEVDVPEALPVEKPPTQRKPSPTWRNDAGALVRNGDGDLAQAAARHPGVSNHPLLPFTVGMLAPADDLLIHGLRIASSRFLAPADVPVGNVGTPIGLMSVAQLHRSYDPALPQGLAGGFLDLQLPEPTPEPTWTASAALGVRPGSTFAAHPGYNDSGTGLLGNGNGDRTLPPDLPPRDAFGSGTEAQRVDLFDHRWGIESQRLQPDTTLALSTTGEVEFGHRRLGYGTALIHRHEAWASTQTVNRYVRNDDQLEPLLSLERPTTTERLQLGAAGGVTFDWADGQRLAARALFLRNSTDMASSDRGYSVDHQQFIGHSELTFEQRQAAALQVESRNELGAGFSLSLTYSYGTAHADQPDARWLTAVQSNGTNLPRADIPWELLDANHAFNRAVEITHDARAELSTSHELPASLTLESRAGISVLRRIAQSRGRSFQFRVENGRLDTDPNVVVDTGYGFSLAGTPINAADDTSDPYLPKRVTTDAIAPYAALSLGKTEAWSVAFGMRYEDDDLKHPEGRIHDAAFAPSLAVTLQPSEHLGFELTGSRTRTRVKAADILPPLGPPLQTNYQAPGAATLRANGTWNGRLSARLVTPALRAEVATFATLEDSPMVVAPVPGTSDSGFSPIWRNARRGSTYGAEISGRLDLGHAAGAAKGLYMSGQLTLQRRTVRFPLITQSDGVPVSEDLDSAQTLLGLQAGYSADAGTLPLDAAVAYLFDSGAAIAPGFFGSPEVLASAYHRLDLLLAYRVSPEFHVRFAARNLLAMPARATIGGQLQRRVPFSRLFELGVSLQL